MPFDPYAADSGLRVADAALSIDILRLKRRAWLIAVGWLDAVPLEPSEKDPCPTKS